LHVRSSLFLVICLVRLGCVPQATSNSIKRQPAGAAAAPVQAAAVERRQYRGCCCTAPPPAACHNMLSSLSRIYSAVQPSHDGFECIICSWIQIRHSGWQRQRLAGRHFAALSDFRRVFLLQLSYPPGIWPVAAVCEPAQDGASSLLVMPCICIAWTGTGSGSATKCSSACHCPHMPKGCCRPPMPATLPIPCPAHCTIIDSNAPPSSLVQPSPAQPTTSNPTQATPPHLCHTRAMACRISCRRSAEMASRISGSFSTSFCAMRMVKADRSTTESKETTTSSCRHGRATWQQLTARLDCTAWHVGRGKHACIALASRAAPCKYT
jgi:hypothetical protein